MVEFVGIVEPTVVGFALKRYDGVYEWSDTKNFFGLLDTWQDFFVVKLFFTVYVKQEVFKKDAVVDTEA